MSYLRFVVLPANRRRTTNTAVLARGSGARLGEILWYGEWRQYCFCPSGSTVLSDECLEEVRAYIASLMAARAQDGAPPPAGPEPEEASEMGSA